MTTQAPTAEEWGKRYASIVIEEWGAKYKPVTDAWRLTWDACDYEYTGAFFDIEHGVIEFYFNTRTGFLRAFHRAPVFVKPVTPEGTPCAIWDYFRSYMHRMGERVYTDDIHDDLCAIIDKFFG